MARTPTSVRICKAYACDEPLPPRSRGDRKFCSNTCSARMNRARARARERAEAGEPPTTTDRLLQAVDDVPLDASTTTTEANARTRRDRPSPAEAAADVVPTSLGGEGFQRFVRTSPSLPAAILDGAITARAAATSLNVSPATISAWLALYNSLTSQTHAARQWDDDPAAQDLRTHALSSFRNFCEVFFPDDLFPEFHEEWDERITTRLDEGGRSLLLAAQRHGKSTFNFKQCLYRIAKHPNIAIIWVGKTADLARKIVGVVRQYLENDPHFASVLLPPDTSFRPPPRRGIPWTNDEFTVSTRTEIRKSPTMLGIGIGGSILGRDADLIFIDDPIDRAMCLSPTQRSSVEEWFFTDFNSRIEEHTGVVYIGSRQHKDDLPGAIIDNNAARITAGHEPDWDVMVYRAHDPGCETPLEDHLPFDPDSTDPLARHDCVLWPSVRSAAWLAEQQRNNPEHFERNYQANPLGTLHRPVREEDVEHSYRLDRWLSTSRRSPITASSDTPSNTPRTFGQPHRTFRLVASVDPAVAKRNAAVLWCFSTSPVPLPVDPTDPDSSLTPRPVRAIVDYAEPDPGSPGVSDILERWYGEYHVTDWVFETNYFADQIANDRTINDIRAKHGMRFLTHWTSQHNKHDAHAGVLAMLASLRARPTSLLLPGTTPASKRELERFVRQMLDYDPEATHTTGGRRNSKLDDDLVMAAWFGWYWIEQQTRPSQSRIKFDYGDSYVPYRWNTPPWEGVA